MTTTYRTTILKSELVLSHWLENSKDPDYAHIWETIAAGEICYVRRVAHEDGRIYFLYFKEINGKLFSYQCMTQNDKMYPNCGLITPEDERNMKAYLSMPNSKNFIISVINSEDLPYGLKGLKLGETLSAHLMDDGKILVFRPFDRKLEYHNIDSIIELSEFNKYFKLEGTTSVDIKKNWDKMMSERYW